MSYTSREPYAAQPTPLTARGPDPRAASLVSDTLAQNLAHVSQQFMGVWGAIEQAKTVNAAGAYIAKASMAAVDMEKGFAADGDPSTVPQRFPEKAAELRAATLDGLDPAVAAHVARAFDTQIMPNTYRQVIGVANQRNIGNLRGQLSSTLSSHAGLLAEAKDEPQVLAQIQGMKSALAGNEAAGVINKSDSPLLLSHTLKTAITIRSAADPVGAQALLDRFKDQMDAGDVAALTTSLRAPVERRQDENAVQSRIRAAGGVSNIADAIMAQESGGRDGLVSVNGARGAMQITPGTFAQYAQPGESIDNPEHNRAVGRRIIDDLSARFGGDPARIAVGYFSGPGNVAPAGSPTPWKEDRKDGNGMSVSRYVAQVTARLAPAGANPAQRDVAIADIRRDGEAQGLPLHRILSQESMASEWYAHQSAQNQQARALLHTDLKDLSATYLGGNTTAEIPEARIRALSPDATTAQRTIDELTLARTAGDTTRAIAYASPAEQEQALARIAGNPNDTYLAAERQQMRDHVQQGIQRARTALKDDPGGYAMSAPEVRTLIAQGADRQQIAAASIAVQARMGVLPGARRILGNDQATVIADLLRNTGPDKADMGATLASVARDFGAADADPARRAAGAGLFNAALGELARQQHIGWEWLAFAGMDRPEQAQGRALLQQALKLEAERGGPEALLKLAPADVAKQLPGELDSALADLRGVTSHHPGGPQMFDNVRRAVETIARMRAYKGEAAGTAAKNAYNDVVGAKWEPAGDDGSGWMFDTPTMLVPKGQSGAIETSLSTVRRAITPADITPLPDPMRPGASEAELRAATASAAQRGFWINNADGSGAVLVGRSTGGGIVNIRRADGQPITVLFERLPNAAQLAAGASVLPRTSAEDPAPTGGLSVPPGPARRPTFLEIMSRPSIDPYGAVLDIAGDYVGGLLGMGVARMPPAVQQGSEMPASTVTAPDRRAERLPMGRFALPSLPSWSDRAQQRYPARRGTPTEGDR